MGSRFMIYYRLFGAMTASTAAAFLFTACGSGFQTNSQSTAASTESPTGTKTPDQPGPADSNAAWKDLSIEGNVNGGAFNQTQVLGIDKTAKELIVRLPMLLGSVLEGVTLEFPVDKLPGARFTLDTLSNGSSALVLRIPLKYVVRGVTFLPASRLPNGDPLPSVPDGELPSVAVQLTKSKDVKATIYLAPTIVALYVNSPFDPFIKATFPIRNAARTRTWGYFSVIPAKPSVADGGFFLSIALPSDLARLIDDNL